MQNIKDLIGWIKQKRTRKIFTIFLVIITIFGFVNMIFLRPRIAFADTTLGFDEGYGTVVNDSNGNVSGTITNALWRTDELCFDGRCLYFDGTGDFISFGDDADLDKAAADNFTIQGWFRTPDITSGQRTIIAKYNSATGTDGGYKVYMDSSGYLIFGIDDDQTSFPEDSVSTTTTSFDDNKWHHFAVVKTGTTSITIYVDGVQYQTDSSISSTGTLANTDAFYVGIDGDGSSNGYSGFLDQVKVYNSTRTATEIKSDIAGQSTNRGVSVSFEQSQNFLSDGLVGYWTMNESAANSCTGGSNDVCDKSGNGNDGAWNGNVANTTAKFANGTSYDGTGDYVSIADSNSLDMSSSFSISGWVNWSSLPGSSDEDFVISKGDSTKANYYITYTNYGSRVLVCGFYNNDVADNSAEFTVTLSTSTWYHIACSFDDSANLITLYINGNLVATQSTVEIPTTNTGEVRLGRERDVYEYYLNGTIDDFRLYNRPLSVTEIAKLYSWAPGPDAHWKLDENTGQTLQDSSGNGNVSTTWTGTNTWDSGKYGSSLNFNNNDGVVRMAETSTTTDLGNADSYTVSAWVKTSDSSASTDDVVAKHGTNSGASPFRIYLASTTRTAGMTVRDASVGVDVTGTVQLNDNKWHHIVGIRDVAADSVYLYVDGVLVDTDVDPTTGSIANNDDISIGNGRNGYTTDDFNGSIDDVRIYKYVRTPAQIVEDMNAGHSAPSSPLSSAAVEWNFDEGYGTTAFDASINLLNLTLSATAWTNNGKFNKAWDGNAARWLSITDAATGGKLDFSATEDFSISMWFKTDTATNPSSTEYLLSKAEASAGYRIFADNASTGEIRFGIDDDTTWTPGDYVSTTTDVYDTSWHHIVVTKLGTSKIQMYLDGLLKDEDTSLIEIGTLANSITLYLGDRNGVDGGDEFNGDLDAVRIYRSALTAEQVKAEFNQGQMAVLGAVSTNSSGVSSWSANDEYCPPGQGSTCTPPILHWKMDENIGASSTNDSTGNGYTGTLNGSMTVDDWVTGKLGSALDFDGIDDNLQNTSVSLPTGDFTYSTWIYPTSLGTSNAIFGLAQASIGGNELMVDTDTDGDIDVVLDNGALLINGTNGLITTNRWQHIAITRIGSTVTTYINGKIDGTGTDSDALSLASCGLRVGTNQSSTTCSSAGSNLFSGRIDDFRIYNYGRTAAQVAWDYNLGAPVALWELDECTGTTINDSMGNISAGSVVPGAGSNTAAGTCSSGNSAHMWNDGTTGKINGSLGFDNTDDAVTFTADDKLNLTTGGTIAAWVYPNSTGENSFGRILDKSSDTSATGGYAMGISGNSFYGEMTNGLNTSCTSLANSIPFSQWSHVAWTFDGTNWLLYVNGVLDTTCATSRLPSATSLGVTIGNRQGATDRTFDGLIDEVRVYNFPLTAHQIKTIKNDGSAVRFTQ